MPIVVPGGGPFYLAGVGDAVDTATLVQRVRRWLKERPYTDTLSAGYTAGGTTVSLTRVSSWSDGEMVEIDDNTGSLFEILPTAGAELTNPVTVRAAALGSPDENHSSGAYVFKDPRFFYIQIQEEIHNVIQSLWPWAWRINQQEITILNNGQTKSYDLNDDFVDLISASQVQGVTPAFRTMFYGAVGSLHSVSIDRNVSADIASSGKAITFDGFPNLDNPIIVTYRTPFIPDDIDNGLIWDGLLTKTIVMGACANLLDSENAVRSAQDQTPTRGQPSSQDRVTEANWFKNQFEDHRQRLNAFLMRQQKPAGVWER